MDVFSKRLKLLRNEHNLKQSDLAEAMHFSGAMASAYENGREPSYDMLVNIATYFGVSTDYLLGLSSVKRNDSNPLLSAVDQAAAAAEAAGAASVTAEDLQALFSHLAAYLGSTQSAGTLPVKVTTQLITGMTTLLAALNSGSASAVIDANNELLGSVLGVSSITTAHLNTPKEENT